jgi:hypothetical protein
VLLPLQGRQSGEGVGVLGAAHDHGVEVAVFQIVVQLAEIAELPGPGRPVRHLEKIRLVHVAKRHHVLAQHLLHVMSAAAAAADDRDIELRAR